MRWAAVILLVASGCSLVMSRPSGELQADEPVGTVRGPILSSINGFWHGVSDKVHDIKDTVVKPVVEGVVEGAEGAKDIFKDTVNGVTTDLLKPIIDIANGISDKVDGIKVTVIKPVGDGVQEAANGAIYIFQDTVNGINTAVIIPALDAAHAAASNTWELATDTAIVINSGFIQHGVDTIYQAANSILEAIDGAVNDPKSQ